MPLMLDAACSYLPCSSIDMQLMPWHLGFVVLKVDAQGYRRHIPRIRFEVARAGTNCLDGSA
ncbi:hypothetical protein U1763_02750 [Sphingomonas sp. LB2R24]|uniref:hypothetical protein n=1 Tax=Sphingomonas sorbitolis TaxID=3096165 RepID=UPI002FC5DD1E